MRPASMGPDMRRGTLGSLTDVRGVRVGSAEDASGSTGVTVVTFDRPVQAAAEVRGGAPGTYHTDALGPLGRFGWLSALFLSGGSSYGLDASRGIRRALWERGEGSPIFGRAPKVIGISGAILFDLGRQDPGTVDYDALGYRATRTASRRPVIQGSVGAGAGAKVAKLLGPGRSSRGGLGSASLSIGGHGHLGVLVVANSVGFLQDPLSGSLIASPRASRGGALTWEGVWKECSRRPFVGSTERGTTLAIVVTDLALPRLSLFRLAAYAHDGIARVVVPAHTSTDGDTVFVASTGGIGRRDPTPRDETRDARSFRTVDALAVPCLELIRVSLLRAVQGAPPSPDPGRESDSRGKSPAQVVSGGRRSEA